MTDSNGAEGGQAADNLVVYDFDPRNLPPEYLQAVGLTAMASAQTEHVVQDFIGALVGADNIETLAMTTNMSAPLRDKIARALLELNATAAAVVDDVDDLLDGINEALAKRNTLVHSPLIRNPSTGEILSHRLKMKGSLQLELRPITVAEIEQDAVQIYEAGMALMQFMMVNNIAPRFRQHPIREPLDRGQKARQNRRNPPAGPAGTAEA